MTPADLLTSCDPEFPAWMCITGAELQIALAVLVLVVLFFGIRGIVRPEMRKHAYGKPQHGVDPSRNGDQTWLAHNMSSHGGGKDHLTLTAYTRDPQAHARAFIPDTARKKNK